MPQLKLNFIKWPLLIGATLTGSLNRSRQACHSRKEGIRYGNRLLHLWVNRKSHSDFAQLRREVSPVLSTTTTRKDGVIVVYAHGGMFFGEESACLRSLVKELLQESRQFVFDLGDVTQVDSGGVGTLVAVYASARKAGGNIKFANLSNRTREVLHTTNLLSLFEIFDTTNEAISSFSKDRKAGA